MGKTLGIIGFGRIGQETAKIALGIGMDVMYCDKYIESKQIELNLAQNNKISFNLQSSNMEDLLKKSDYVTLHVPAQKDYVIGKQELDLMKNGSGLINAARGGVIDELSLIKALDNGKLEFAGLDTFENEPTPSIKLLMNPKVSITPHIGAATTEAQDRIGVELGNQIISLIN